MSRCDAVADVPGLVHGCSVAACAVDVSSDGTVSSVSLLQ